VPCKLEGKDTGDWVLIDTGDVIVHVFRPEVRDFYQLEKMWLPCGGRNGAVGRPVRVHVLAVGRLRTGPERALVDDYLSRFEKTGRGLGLTLGGVIEVEDRKSGGKDGEAHLLRKAIPDGAALGRLTNGGGRWAAPTSRRLWPTKGTPGAGTSR
jgi:hypothetical protein